MNLDFQEKNSPVLLAYMMLLKFQLWLMASVKNTLSKQMQYAPL